MFWLSTNQPKIRYISVTDLEHEAEPEFPSVRQSTKLRGGNFSLLLVISHTSLFFLAYFAGIFSGQKSLFTNADSFCSRHISQDSAVLHNVKIEYALVHFNGSLFKENAFRGPAGPEVDAAWESLGVNYRSLRVPAELADASNLAPDQVKINAKYGGGYPANVEGLHHLHCLNLLRQALHYNFDYYHALGQGPFQNDDHVLQSHVTHCLDIVRQQLMCSIDTGLLGQIWLYPDAPEAFVDFNTKHTCKNFDAVRAWAETNQLLEDTPEDFLQPPQPADRIWAEIP